MPTELEGPAVCIGRKASSVRSGKYANEVDELRRSPQEHRWCGQSTQVLRFAQDDKLKLCRELLGQRTRGFDRHKVKISRLTIVICRSSSRHAQHSPLR